MKIEALILFANTIVGRLLFLLLPAVLLFYHRQIVDISYLKTRVAADIVLFGMRMLLAYNEKLFPCQKWLMQIVSELDRKPENIVNKANEFLQKLDNTTKDDFVDSILSFCDWNVPVDYSKVLSRFIEDNEQWWYNNRPNIAEW